MSPKIEIIVAGPGERATLENLFQLYVHDFSEFWDGRPEGELGDDGRFEPYSELDAYWREADRIPLLLRLDGRLVGFALVNAVGHGGGPVDRNMAEFFIARKHRRGGVGTAAAGAVFSLYSGQWETAVARANIAALAFWRHAVSGHPDVTDVEELDVTSPAWNGPVIRFRIAPSSPSAPSAAWQP
jgi:predicted acetyltransferase